MAKTWVRGVRDKLSNSDGLQLLKILYYKDEGICERDLDGAKSPIDLYTLSKNILGENDALDLLIHRVRLLVPQDGGGGGSSLDQNRLLQAKDLGARSCLDYLTTCRIAEDRENVLVDALLSPGAKLLECLVATYVNLSPRKRGEFGIQLTSTIGFFRGNYDLFNVFVRFLLIEHEDKERVIDHFLNILNSIKVPQFIAEFLRNQLATHSIQYPPLSAGEACIVNIATHRDNF